jgi:hypothetical protein
MMAPGMRYLSGYRRQTKKIEREEVAMRAVGNGEWQEGILFG